MRRSDDLNYWHRLNQVFPSIPEWGSEEVPGVSNIWTPDIFYRDSTYHLYYSLSTFGSNHSIIGLATNKTLDLNMYVKLNCNPLKDTEKYTKLNF